MAKNLFTVCMGLTVLAALALPATASASPVLTENGVAVAVGKKITATQVGTSKFTNTEGTRTQLECSTGTMTGELTKNNGSEIEGKITSLLFGGTGPQATGEPMPECTGESIFGNVSVTAVVSSVAPWCVRSAGEDKFAISGGACPGGGTLKLKTVTTLAGTCEYESTGSMGGTYNTGGTSATLTVTSGHGTENGFKLIAGGFACPTSYMYDMQFTLETDSATVEPLTIS